mgnify:CR=1 FL=1
MIFDSSFDSSKNPFVLTRVEINLNFFLIQLYLGSIFVHLADFYYLCEKM